MGKLIDRNRTRKAREAREERARRILDAAHLAFGKMPYAEVTLDAIGKKAGVKHGQASLAFRSREELFMTVIRSQLTDWYDSLEKILTGEQPPSTKAELAETIAQSLAQRPDLTRLLGSLITALELHEDGMEVHRFFNWQRDRLLDLGAAMAERVDGVHQWDAFDALYRGQTIAAAVHPVSRLSGNLAVDLLTDDLQVFALDLEDEVQRAVLDTLEG